MSIKDVPGDKKATSQSAGADSSPMRRAMEKPPLMGEVAARPERLSFKSSIFYDTIKEKSR